MTSVALIGSGYSIKNLMDSADEVWTLNSSGFAPELGATLMWLMDDLRNCTARSPAYRVELAAFAARAEVPFFTSRAYPEFPMAREFPLDLAIMFMQDCVFRCQKDLALTFFNNSIAYPMVHFAMGFVAGDYTELHLHGVDFIGNRAEKVQHVQPVTLLYGWLLAKGAVVKLNPASFLLDFNKLHLRPNEPLFYGYYPELELETEIKRRIQFKYLKAEFEQ